MAIFTGISQTFSSYVTPRKPSLQQRYPTPDASDTIEQRLNEEPLSPHTKAKAWLEASAEGENLDNLEGETLLNDLKQSGKRTSPPGQVEERPAKRHKSNERYEPSEDEEDGDFEGDTLLASTPHPFKQSRPNHNVREDRQAMPPPPKPAAIRLNDEAYLPAKHTIDRNLQNNIVRNLSFARDSDFSEDEIFTKKTAIRREDRSEVNPQFEYDRALRHAQAQQLPEGSGIWTDVDKDLFYRLAMRGFEPLVPGHWTMDFKTLPQQLFSTAEQEPLILPFSQREFRAKHYLRSLFGIAANVRDKSLAGLRTEPTIKRTLRQYVSWALSDAGVHPLQRPNVIPVHALVTKRPSESTDAVLRRMTRKLYKLARRYQEVYHVQQSIEPQSHIGDPFNFNEGPSGPQYDNNAHMPTLIGLMVARSVVAVVTLDSRSNAPESLFAKHNTIRRRSSSIVSSLHEEDSVSGLTEDGLRFIANFDFSNSDGYDVWDGLAIAICVMRVRKTMLELCERAEGEGMAGTGEMWERVWPGMNKTLGSEAEE
jgi:hypothetical protein